MAYCQYCGAPIIETDKFCRSCGSPIIIPRPAEEVPAEEQNGTPDSAQGETNNPVNYNYSQNVNADYPVINEPAANNDGAGYNSYTAAPQAQVGFKEAVAEYFSRYFDFSGRSCRSAYWYVLLFNLIVSFANGVINGIMPESGLLKILNAVFGLYILGAIIPSIAVTVRRFHDVGKSGLYLFLPFIPVIGIIWGIILLCKESAPDNEWGPSPVQNNPYDNNINI
ncbi:MAG: DUF805 domain-containing protein [Clostridia bacterium]|nr:DUF805 domain-containing protein [Clostridia bacterium]